MKVSVTEIQQKMQDALVAKAYSDDEVEFIIEMYLGGELRGHVTHGLANFASFVKKDYSNLEKPEVIKQTAALYMVDAKSNPGVIMGMTAANEAIDRAKNEIVGVSLVKNMGSWLRPGAIAQYIAKKGYVAIVMNDGGGTSIAPPGGFDPTLGTNPIAYGIPTGNNPLVVDLATSKKAWGQVRLANKYGTNLPEDTFYDDKGNITVDPNKAHSVLPFGDHKGYALALLVEILCGSLIGKAMMIASEAGNQFGAKFPDRGGLIIVIDPGQTVGLERFKNDNDDLLDRIKATRPLDGQIIRIPGERAGELEVKAYDTDEFELPDELWSEIKEISDL